MKPTDFQETQKTEVVEGRIVKTTTDKVFVATPTSSRWFPKEDVVGEVKNGVEVKVRK